MISTEPVISVGVVEGRPAIDGRFEGTFGIGGRTASSGTFRAWIEGEAIHLDTGGASFSGPKGVLQCVPLEGAVFSLDEVTIGIRFHWERQETQTFAGALILQADDRGTLTAVNELPLETYLASVVSSEMNALAPLAFLQAHVVASRSWLLAMLERRRAGVSPSGSKDRGRRGHGEILRWYGREDHGRFDVCADDHCQRYQGLTKMVGGKAGEAVRATRGLALVHDAAVCDARYYKACGGITDCYENAWEDRTVPYLTSISDAPHSFSPIRTEAQARRWVLSRPDCYCNTADATILEKVLPDFDRETTDFFRWEVSYDRKALEAILKKKSGIDFGDLQDMTPLERGPSGRIVRLRIAGSRQAVVVGKELEIRRWLSNSHLLSSAFVVDAVGGAGELPDRFILHGAGWGHGVGMCQIGAAMMAHQGYTEEEILGHYFPAATLRRLYP